MRAIDVLKLYMESEEYRIEVDSIDPDSLLELVEVPLEAQVIINNGIRRRLVFLAFLKIVYDCDPEFVRDYLNLQHSLEEIHKKYGVYTELEYVALHCMHAVRDEDASHALKKLKTFILSRKSNAHGL
ncbi:hypothetical protein DFR87_08645 [Metallosphaera hakonensis JCM 8857 = DSM 7519]|uniref:Uncharacterized protein n=2 Tax=Metallosphaera hakonensis TaxID=79601 RepID=A0A2U9IXC9_9CREN|nr:hypothetical protein DFR87_08645 [Metallosphaera hakonensis JCM 8857 = DSM 7519]